MHITLATPLTDTERQTLVAELKNLTSQGKVLLAHNIGFTSDSNPIVILPEGQACGWTGAQRVEQLSDPELRLALASGVLHPAGSLALREALELSDAPEEVIHWVGGGAHPQRARQRLLSPMRSEPILACRDLRKSHGAGALAVDILHGIDLDVFAGEVVAIVGASGSGKSTLLQILGGLDAPTNGEASLLGEPWAAMTPSRAGIWRNRHLGFVYQFHHLLAELSAIENVELPLAIRREGPYTARLTAIDILHKLGLSDRLHHKPSELSGGERQRTAIARALAGRPACILADEPTGNLDRASAEPVFGLFQELAAAQGAAVVLATHDMALAERCDRRLLLAGGLLGSLAP